MIGLRPDQGDDRLGAHLEGDFHDWPMCFKDAEHRLGDVTGTKIPLFQEVGDSNLRNGFGSKDPAGLRLDGAQLYCTGNGPSHKVHSGDILDALELFLVVFLRQ